MEPIKPCPFCGGEGKLFNEIFVLFIRCRSCWAKGPNAYEPSMSAVMENRGVSASEAFEIARSIGIQRAINSWNKRLD